MACLQCGAGNYSTLNGASACDLCPAGHECPDPSKAPTKCPPGKFSVIGQQTCTLCPQGQYSLNQTSTFCTVCGPGKKRFFSVALLCRYINLQNLTMRLNSSCQLFLHLFLGRYCPDVDKEPVPCSIGTASSALGLHSGCSPCPMGTYADRPGLAYCIKCPPGYICTSSRSSESRCEKDPLTGLMVCDDGIHIG